MKRIFKIRFDLERNGSWSGRESEFLCYLLKLTDTDDTVYGFSSCISATSFASPRYVKGVMSNTKLLIMQFTNTYGLAPICCFFSSLDEDGLWSSFDIRNNIFPIFSETKRADGRVRLTLSEVPYTEEKENTINSIVSEYLTLSDIKLNNDIIRKPNNLSNLLNDFVDET